MSLKVWLTLCRLCLGAWVGVAPFFVVLVVALRGSDLFTAETKLNHPRILFPIFYRFEFALLGLALGFGLCAWRGGFRRPALRAALWLLVSALAIATIDYLAIYAPLDAMLDPAAREPSFRMYHQLSQWVNLSNMLVCTVAAGLAVWPKEAGDAAG
ncbi:MAG: hypothetical protein ACKV0T_28000 [Planctomycetales bacterium]